METPQRSSVIDRSVRLSLSQREVWLDQRAWPGSSHLNIGGGAFLSGCLDLTRFKTALVLLVAENEALRLAPRLDGSQALLAVHSPVLEWVDLSEALDPKSAMRDWWQRWITEPFALDGKPPWRFALLHASDVLHGLTIQFHHLVMDGWGTSLVMQRWSEIYNSLESGNSGEFAGASGYLAFIEESNAYAGSEAFERDAAYWKSQLPVIPSLLVSRRYTQARELQLPASRLVTQGILRADYARLDEHASNLGLSAFTFFLAALGLYFARINNVSEVVLGIPSLNRSGKRYRTTQGMFVGVLAVKLVVTEHMKASDWLTATGTAVRGALRHARYPLSELGKGLQVIRAGRDGLIDVLLSFERQDYSVAFGSAKLVESRQIFSGTSRYPLGVTVCEFHPEQDLELTLEASCTCFSGGEPEYLGRRLWQLVESLMAFPEMPVQAMPLLPTAESRALLQELHKDIVCHAVPQTYLSKFEHQATLRPDATALVWDGGGINYGTLDRLASQLAVRLATAGAVRGTIVALAMTRSPHMVAALLAITKAGAAFLPLDTDAPLARLAQILQDSAACVLLIDVVDEARFAHLHSNTLILESRVLLNEQVHEDVRRPVTKIFPADAAYVLFTSGSTGRPKGVVVSHATLSRRLAWLSRAYAVDWRDRSAQATQLTFDPSMIELFLPLIHGASVALPPPGRNLPESLADFAIRHGVSIMAFVPSTLSRFLDGAVGKNGLKLRVACCGGESLAPELAKRFISQTRACLFNVYGPTEAAIFASAWQCDVNWQGTTLPIGRAVDDTRIYVLDARQVPMPFGVTGEIFIGGAALSQGYLNHPELDELAFFDDPFDPGSRMYRTGDMGWFAVDGNLYFSGRADRQVKLRGYRIELGEIEAAYLTVEGVNQVAVQMGQFQGKSVIRAWVTTRSGVNAENLQRALRERLPDYMVPSAVTVLKSLPATPIGKIDYQALSASNQTLGRQQQRLPESTLERDLQTLWQGVLQVKHVGVTDNFFEVGGDSLAAVGILTGIERLLGRRIPMYILTEHPTIEQLADALAQDVKAPCILTNLYPGCGGRVPLYLAASGNGDLLRFQNLARALAGTFDVKMLQPPTDETFKTVAELAVMYANEIAAQRQDAGFVAGFSVGGVAALETARVLKNTGAALRGLVLIDTIYPQAALGGATSWRVLGWLVRNLHVQELSLNGRRLGAMFNDPGLISQVIALVGYKPANFDGPTWLIKSSGLASWDRLFFRPWRKHLTSSLREELVPGLHGSIFDACNVGAVASAINRVLEQPNVHID